MSNEHDTHEPTSARLTEAQVKSLYLRLSHDENVESGAAYSENRQLTLDDVRALLAEVARLQREHELMERLNELQSRALQRHIELLAAAEADKGMLRREIASLLVERRETGEWADAMNAQNVAMRPLVEAVARLPFHTRTDTGISNKHIHDALALAATWQTPAAPTPDGHTAPNGENDRG
jgi:hypothetical protein